jgi:hypothetical protein
MKPIYKLAAAALLALSSASLASAQTGTFHVTGSTAYRVADVTAEVALCGGSNAKATFYGSSLTGANYSVVTNSTGTLKFENYFNGSIAGDTALVAPVTLPFPSATDFPPTATVTAGSAPASAGVAGTPATGGTAKAAPTNNSTLAPYATDPHAPDIAFSDVFFDTAQQILQNATPANNNTPSGGTTGNIVGIVPFVFVTNASTDVTDITGLSMDPQKFTFLWENGTAPLSFFTGKNADETKVVYAMGRDIDSGTRSTALSETGYGLNGSQIVTTGVEQYYAFNNSTSATNDNNTANADPTGIAGFSATSGVIGDDSTAGTTIGFLGLVPQESVPGDNYFMGEGDGGYFSGGNLATALSAKFSISATVVMTYLGVSDATTALKSTQPQTATLMAYNGYTFVPNSPSAANSSLIYEGQYTFWGYEHEYFTSTASTVAGDLKTELNTGIDELSSNNVTFNSMEVSRQDDGQNVQPNGSNLFNGVTLQ